MKQMNDEACRWFLGSRENFCIIYGFMVMKVVLKKDIYRSNNGM